MLFGHRDGRKGIFQTERKDLLRSTRMIVLSICFTFIVTVGVWTIFISGWFSLDRVEVEGLQGLQEGAVASTTFALIDSGHWKPWDRRNLFFINPKILAEELKEQLFLESAVVEKSYPNILRLILRERQRSIVLSSKDQLLLVDVHGVVTGEADSVQTERIRRLLSKNELMSVDQLPVIVFDLPEPAAPGYQAASAQAIRGWLEASKNLLEARIRHRYIRVPNLETSTMYVQTDGNIDIVLERGSTLQTQIEVYRKFMESKPKDLKIHEYIDVRVPGKVYIK
ncbi:hypothetical protein IT408_01460 [Candidatus Uhrbacteria bacterium]|nr:hypothetical protein [Candidatus Uhrbacteria bacterium]